MDAKNTFWLKSLGINLDLHPRIDMKYSEDFYITKPYLFSYAIHCHGHVGVTINEKKLVLEIKIHTPTKDFIKEHYEYYGRKVDIDLVYHFICAHEETHALQNSGNYKIIPQLLEGFLTQNELERVKETAKERDKATETALSILDGIAKGESMRDKIEDFHPEKVFKKELSERDANLVGIVSLLQRGFEKEIIKRNLELYGVEEYFNLIL